MLDLTTVELNWSHFDATAVTARTILGHLAADRPSIRALVDEVGTRRNLLALSQERRFLHYLVVYDALERGLQIRIHLATGQRFDLPHNHEFSFATLILAGGYRHRIYQPRGLASARAHRSDRRPVLERWEGPGSAYALHHEAFHTVLPISDAASIVLRGPLAPRDSIALDPERREIRIRTGSLPARRAARHPSMDAQAYLRFRQRLLALGVI